MRVRLMEGKAFLSLVVLTAFFALIWLPDPTWGKQPGKEKALGGEFDSSSVYEEVYRGVAESVYQENVVLRFGIQSQDFAGGMGTKEDPWKIANAYQLNKVRSNLSAHYELIADIDLGVPPYNEGAGWAPIGTKDIPFSGTFDGNGFTITNLTINRPDTSYIGLFGCTGSDAEIRNVKLENVIIEGGIYVGSLVGYNRGTITNSGATANASDSKVDGKEAVGGLAGHNEGTITNSWAGGKVTANRGPSHIVGGLVGRNAGAITNSYAAGEVSGAGPIVGGLSGSNTGIIQNSYAAAAVTGSNDVGGLAGINRGTITNCYATGQVPGKSRSGGLVGDNTNGTVSNSYYDKDTTGRSDTGKGTPKTTGEMKQLSTFAGWDFASVWYIHENNSCPRLRWEQETWPDYSGFHVALEIPGSKKVDEAFSLRITDAKGIFENSLNGDIKVTITSNQSGQVCNGTITFTGGDATVPITLNVSGEHHLTVEVDAVTNSQQVTVTVVAVLERIEIIKPPAKTQYFVGEALDLTGLVVAGIYNDSKTRELTITGANISGFDSSASAETQVITVTYEGKSATFTVAIKPDTEAPSAPANLRSTGKTTTSISLAWDQATDNAGVSHYEVEMKPDSGSWQQVAAPSGTAYTQTNLTPSTTYTFRVRAVDKAGNPSSWSAELMVSTGSSSSGGGGSSGSRDSSYNLQSFPLTGLALTEGDKLLGKARQEEGQARLSLAEFDGHGVILSVPFIQWLVQENLPLILENSGLVLRFPPYALDNEQISALDKNAYVKISGREITGEEKQEILDNLSPAGNGSLFEVVGALFDLSIQILSTGETGEQEAAFITGFNEPVTITISLAHLGQLTQEQIDRLKGVRLGAGPDGTLIPIELGGTYDPETQTFSFITDRFSLYTVIMTEKETRITLTLGQPRAMINGAACELDAAPCLKAEVNRALVPVRFISEALGAQVEWQEENRQVIIRVVRDQKPGEISLTIGSAEAMVNGTPVQLDCPAELAYPPGRTFVPLRFVSEALGARVDWNSATQSITITMMH